MDGGLKSGCESSVAMPQDAPVTIATLFSSIVHSKLSGWRSPYWG